MSDITDSWLYQGSESRILHNEMCVTPVEVILTRALTSWVWHVVIHALQKVISLFQILEQMAKTVLKLLSGAL